LRIRYTGIQRTKCTVQYVYVDHDHVDHVSETSSGGHKITANRTFMLTKKDTLKGSCATKDTSSDREENDSLDVLKSTVKGGGGHAKPQSIQIRGHDRDKKQQELNENLGLDPPYSGGFL
jgi:hypothetical protein